MEANYNLGGGSTALPETILWRNNRQIRLAIPRNWYNVFDLNLALARIIKLNLNNHIHRLNALEELNKLAKPLTAHGVTAAIRFPDDLELVFEDNCFWARDFLNLRSALATEKSNGVANQRIHDAVYSASNILMDMQRRLMKATDIIDRNRFENTFRLQWG